MLCEIGACQNKNFLIDAAAQSNMQIINCALGRDNATMLCCKLDAVTTRLFSGTQFAQVLSIYVDG